jgi:hypothetical protein
MLNIKFQHRCIFLHAPPTHGGQTALETPTAAPNQNVLCGNSITPPDVRLSVMLPVSGHTYNTMRFLTSVGYSLLGIVGGARFVGGGIVELRWERLTGGTGEIR